MKRVWEWEARLMLQLLIPFDTIEYIKNNLKTYQSKDGHYHSSATIYTKKQSTIK